MTGAGSEDSPTGISGAPRRRTREKILELREVIPMRSAFLALFCVLAAGRALERGATAPAAAPSVGVVDLARVFEGCEKWRDMQKVLELRREKRQKEIEAVLKEIENLRKKLDRFSPSSKEFLDTQALLIKKEALARTMSAQYDIELQRSEEAQSEALADEINAVCAELARECGISVVIQRTLEMEGGRWESVLYVEPQSDLTKRLIDRLNRKYEAEKK